MPKESPWTPAKAKALDATLSEPHMQDFLAELKERIRVNGRPEFIAPGYDELVLGYGQFHRSAGQSSVIEIIEDMRTEKKTVKELDLTQMFQAPKNRKPE
jgi:hypothetical protein